MLIPTVLCNKQIFPSPVCHALNIKVNVEEFMCYNISHLLLFLCYDSFFLMKAPYSLSGVRHDIKNPGLSKN